MIDLDKIEDAWIADIKAQLTSFKTVETHESSFDEKTTQQLIALSPFCLLRYGAFPPVESERKSDNASGLHKPQYFLSVGSNNLRSAKAAQRGCYPLLRDLRSRYNGFTLTTVQGDVDLAFEDERFLFSEGGLVVYGQTYSYFDE